MIEPLGNVPSSDPSSDASDAIHDDDAQEWNEAFVVDDDTTAENSSPPDDTTFEGDDHDLSSLRIRQVSATRRGANTLRFYGIIALLFLATELVDAAMLYRGAKRGHWVMVAGFLGAAGCVIFISVLVRRVIQTNRALRQSAVAEVAAPPDLSALSDGSQHLRNLEAIGGRTDPEQD